MHGFMNVKFVKLHIGIVHLAGYIKIVYQITQGMNNNIKVQKLYIRLSKLLKQQLRQVHSTLTNSSPLLSFYEFCHKRAACLPTLFPVCINMSSSRTNSCLLERTSAY